MHFRIFYYIATIVSFILTGIFIFLVSTGSRLSGAIFFIPAVIIVVADVVAAFGCLHSLFLRRSKIACSLVLTSFLVVVGSYFVSEITFIMLFIQHPLLVSILLASTKAST